MTQIANNIATIEIMRRPHSNISGYSHPPPNSQSAMPYMPHPALSDPYALYYYHYLNSCYDPSQFNGKRQRRQAAGAVVGSIFNNNNDIAQATNMGRKSTAQPRPALNIPARGIGPIVDPNENDVLCGRGGRINSHSGNIKFRDVITFRKKEYLAPTTKKLQKAHIAAAIVNDIRAMDPPGRFLKEDRDTGLWFDIGDAKAIKKTGQALREDAPDIRHELGGDSSGDEKGDTKKSPPKEKKAAKAKAPTTKAAPKSNHAKQESSVASSLLVNMPPPTNTFPNSYTEQPQQQNAQKFQGRTIPIQMPNPSTVYALPNQLVSGARNVGRSFANASQHAIDALSQTGQPRVPPVNEAFERPFYEPTQVMSASGNTMSTISAMSDPISSTLGNSAISSEIFSGMSGLSGLTGTESARMSVSQRGGHARGSGLGVSGMGQSSRRHFIETLRQNSSGRSAGSLGRSISFGTLGSQVDDSAWQSIMEDETMNQDISRTDNEMFSVASGYRHRDSSAMSIASGSTASSTKWLANMRDTTGDMADDGKSVLSEMSADLHALNLEHPHH